MNSCSQDPHPRKNEVDNPQGISIFRKEFLRNKKRSNKETKRENHQKKQKTQYTPPITLLLIFRLCLGNCSLRRLAGRSRSSCLRRSSTLRLRALYLPGCGSCSSRRGSSHGSRFHRGTDHPVEVLFHCLRRQIVDPSLQNSHILPTALPSRLAFRNRKGILLQRHGLINRFATSTLIEEHNGTLQNSLCQLVGLHLISQHIVGINLFQLR